MFLRFNNRDITNLISQSLPLAYAQIKGNLTNPNLNGSIKFFKASTGVVVVADVNGLPLTTTNIFAFHIHSGSDCSQDADTYPNIGGHFNPNNVLHPLHEGDLPPLFSNNGHAWMAILTNRFIIDEIIGNSIIIHDGPDDFTTQPSGNSGNIIACGIIKRQLK